MGGLFCMNSYSSNSLSVPRKVDINPFSKRANAKDAE